MQKPWTNANGFYHDWRISEGSYAYKFGGANFEDIVDPWNTHHCLQTNPAERSFHRITYSFHNQLERKGGTSGCDCKKSTHILKNLCNAIWNLQKLLHDLDFKNMNSSTNHFTWQLSFWKVPILTWILVHLKNCDWSNEKAFRHTASPVNQMCFPSRLALPTALHTSKEHGDVHKIVANLSEQLNSSTDD